MDVIYRRIEDDFDPLTFRPDSLLVYRGSLRCTKPRVGLANAPGTGVADDKVIYAYVPKIIRYYLGEDSILPNVPTYVCWDDTERQHVLANLDKLVVKAANESGGYGMLIGPHASTAERAAFAERIEAAPRNYIAQPTLALSRAPVIVEDHFEPPCGFASLYPIWPGSRAARRSDVWRCAKVTRGELVARWEQGHLSCGEPHAC